MYAFGSRSMEKLSSCHDDLIRVAKKAILVVDFSIISGHRGQEEQDRYVRQGVSKTPYPKSKHNSTPSRAFDFVPYPIDWNDHKQFIFVAGIILGIGKEMGIDLRWGGDWDRDGSLRNNGFNDYGHIELL